MKTYQLKLIGVVFIVHVIGATLCLSAETLPDGWWQQSPEKVFQLAQDATIKTDYVHTSKAQLLDDPQRGFEFYQRRNSEGKVETKTLSKRGQAVRSAAYTLTLGKFFEADGLLRKIDYEEGPEIEKRIAGTLDHPYEFQILKSDNIGTNECIVVRRKATQLLFDAMASALYGKEELENRQKLAQKNLRAVTDFYVRKRDGVIVGYCKQNFSTTILLEDKIPDSISIGIPIPDEVFFLPGKNSALVVTNLSHATEVMVAQKAKTAGIPGSDPKVKQKRFVIVLICVGTVLIIPIAFAWKRLRAKISQ